MGRFYRPPLWPQNHSQAIGVATSANPHPSSGPSANPWPVAFWPVAGVLLPGPSARTLVPLADRLGHQVRGHWAKPQPRPHG